MILLMLTSIFLNHSARILGINMSISDITLLMLILLLISKNLFFIPVRETFFLIFLSISLILTSIIYTPIKFNVTLKYDAFIINYIKLIIIFFYFLVGYNISKLKLTNFSLKMFSIGSFGVSFIGLVLSTLNINILNNLIYYRNVRFKGLMIDPNYYSIIQNSALVYIIRNQNVKTPIKLLLYIFNFLFIIMSGSKTGMLTLILYSIFLLIEYYIYFKKININSLLKTLSLFSLLLMLTILSTDFISLIFKVISEKFPMFVRIQVIFADFSYALFEGGSGRNETWNSAIGIIKESPLVGVGLGSYSNVNRQLFNKSAVAHNTYLQIFAEWGGILGIIFFSYIGLNITKITKQAKNYKYNSVVLKLRDVLLIFLIGSLSISLNNARIFWIYLGSFIFITKK